MKDRICFSSFVFGSYDKYIPYYIFSILRIYPSSFIKIFIDKELPTHVKVALESLRISGMQQFEILFAENTYDFLVKYQIRGGSFKMVRWLLQEQHFKDFDFVYIGDIDILFLPEEISLLDFHKQQMKTLQVPFSNKVRTDLNGKTSGRLTGLHFLKVKEYFGKISPVIDKFIKEPMYRDNFMIDVERDEHLLYKINKLAFNFNDELLMKAERPWHGVHLGITRGNKNVDLSVIKENTTLSLQDTKQQLIEIIKDPLFQKLQNLVFVVELDVILQELDLHRPLKWKIKRLMYKIDNRFRIQKNIERLKRKLKL